MLSRKFKNNTTIGQQKRRIEDVHMMTKTEKQSIHKGKSRFMKCLPLTLMALPGVVLLFIFHYIPLYGLILPFKDYKVSLGFFKSPWAGLKNFKFLFNSDTVLVATRNTILYNLAFIFVGTAAAVLLAILLFELTRKKVKVYQTVLMLPHFISMVVVAYIVNAILDMDSGVLNMIRIKFGLEPLMWYNTPSYWPVILVLTNLWKTIGYNMVIYYAALMGLDMECFEAATVDGASWWQKVWHITIPGIKSMIVIMVLLSVGNILRGDFGLFYNVPLNSSLLYPTTDVIDTYVYRALMDLGDVGMAAAAGFYQTVIGFILVLSANLLTKKINPENALF